ERKPVRFWPKRRCSHAAGSCYSLFTVHCSPVGVIDLYPLAVSAAHDVPGPGHVVEVPLHGLPQAGVEVLARPPPQLAAYLCGVYRVTAIVAGTVGNVRDEGGGMRAARVELELAQEAADDPD